MECDGVLLSAVGLGTEDLTAPMRFWMTYDEARGKREVGTRHSETARSRLEHGSRAYESECQSGSRPLDAPLPLRQKINLADVHMYEHSLPIERAHDKEMSAACDGLCAQQDPDARPPLPHTPHAQTHPPASPV